MPEIKSERVSQNPSDDTQQPIITIRRTDRGYLVEIRESSSQRDCSRVLGPFATSLDAAEEAAAAAFELDSEN